MSVEPLLTGRDEDDQGQPRSSCAFWASPGVAPVCLGRKLGVDVDVAAGDRDFHWGGTLWEMDSEGKESGKP
jgi:hypothetical protein